MAKKKKDKMQQLMKSDNAIIKDLRDQQWLYNPKVFAQVAGDFSLMHQRVLLGVVEKLQDRIIHSIDENKKDGQLWLPLFSPEEMNTSVDFEIDPRDLGVTPGHYPELAQALKDLVGMTMGYPKKKKDGSMVYTWVSLFSRLEMPMGENGWRTGKIRVKMDKENVNDFLSMNSGWTDHVAKIAQFSKKQRTPRIYIYLSTFRWSGRKQVPYPDFCEFLGIDDDHYVESHKAENPDVKPSDNPFHKYSKVKKLILEPSRLEMDKLSAERKIDFSFTYEDKKNDGRLKGNPTHIEFVIVPGPLGIEREQQKQRHAQEQSLISSYSQHWPDVNAYDLSQLLKEVADEWWEEFKDYAYDGIEKAVEKKQPDHVADYIMALLNTWVNDRRLAEERKRIEQERQYNLFQEEENQRLWRKCMNDIQQKISVCDADLWLYSFEPEVPLLTLGVHDIKVRDEIIEAPEHIPHFAACIRKHFGQKVKLQYRVI